MIHVNITQIHIWLVPKQNVNKLTGTICYANVLIKVNWLNLSVYIIFLIYGLFGREDTVDINRLETVEWW